MQLIASGGGNILLLRDLGRNDAGCWMLDTGYFVHRSFSVGVLDD